MEVIGWLILFGITVGVVTVIGRWLTSALAIILKSTSRIANPGIVDALGNKRLDIPQDLLDLENKLDGIDKEKNQLKAYEPTISLPPVIKEVAYQGQLPKLFSRRNGITSSQIDIEEVRKIAKLSQTPAYALLDVLRGQESILPYRELPPTASVTPPIKWTRWGCEELSYEVDLPTHNGVLRPLNFFVRAAFKNELEQAEALKLRQSGALSRAEKRNSVVEQLYREAEEKFHAAQQKQQAAWDIARTRRNRLVEEFRAEIVKEQRELDSLIAEARPTSTDGLIAKIKQTLQLINLPSFVPANFDLRLDEASRILILEHEFPDIGGVNWVKFVSIKSGEAIKPANQKEAKEAAGLIYPSLSLRLASEVARLDVADLVEAITVNGWANYTEKSTGQTKRAYCSSLFVTKAQILAINLSAADPLAAFATLKGIAARSLELTPIAPVLRLNKEDPRFVDAKEVLETLQQGDNLASMNWEDFEHLCRQLFERAFANSGAEVKVTQASRDQGVDAVIFDPDVLRGGKIVIQAKRYTNAVDVSAVRDLYAAVIHEGATKGILVTTSHYGPDAYSWAKDKPLTLLNGAELLGLLQEHGYRFRIDLAEARRLNLNFRQDR